ncbi:MAG: hypothetical protein HN736_13790 [Anaerolineae bacterium]|jgi:hypothetical protein|nr:hypothetical protein [Anaerolineae bacterium]MBT4309805.1 hypothetical protein [Anaerolineae bacterium]MBT4457062.1 hypothetical protein [Anaerolineae bacterium]MBT4843204.1 hypothetical protein [Anaerolineae bacterium]MBT6063142.1 hypothetical protein [Anaerolineae bacterium]
MTAKNIIDSRLFIRHDLTPAYLKNQDFLKNSHNKAHFLSQILLYDKIIIPTLDFGIIPSLISWLGLRNFRKAIEESSIGFIRRKGHLAYLGGGLGINTIAIERGSAKKWEWWQEALSQESLSAIKLQLGYFCSDIPSKKRKSLAKAITKTNTHLPYDNDFFIKNIAEESYRDIVNSELLSQIALELTQEKKSINLLKLIKGNETKLLNSNYEIRDVTDLVLRVAEVNMELLMASQVDNADLLTAQGSENLLQKKIARSEIKTSSLENFINLLELSNIPDIRHQIIQGTIDTTKIWKLRQSRYGKNFRKWLREVNPSNARDLEKAYVEMLSKENFDTTLPTRVIRFAITTTSGILNPVLGATTSILDSFFVDKWLKGFSPKLFLDELQELKIKK